MDPQPTGNITAESLMAAFHELKAENLALLKKIANIENIAAEQGTTKPAPMSYSEPRTADVETFDGKDVFKARDFLMHLGIFFRAQPNRYRDDGDKLGYAASRLRGTAFNWISPYLPVGDEAPKENMNSFSEFNRKFLETFGEQDRIAHAEAKLHRLKQGNCNESRNWGARLGSR